MRRVSNHSELILSGNSWQSWATVSRHDTKVLDPASCFFFGGNALVQLCKKFYLSATETADFLFEFAQYKKGKKRVRICLMSSVYPISTRFSQNLRHTDTRNRLTVQTVGNALMLSINGPPLEHWGPRKYVISWLTTDRQGALYKPIGLPKSPDNWQCLQTVYQLVYHLMVCCIGWMCIDWLTFRHLFLNMFCWG